MNHDGGRPDSSAGGFYQATLVAEGEAAGRIASALEEAANPEALAVSLFDLGQGRFEVSAYYAEAPASEVLAALAKTAAMGKEALSLRIERLPDADWVTLSQGKRGPVKAGRFFVHGSHDRNRAPGHRFVVKIDAGQAFGTAHHASTRGCLIALDDALKRQKPRHVLDLGTGSGILAIAAAHAIKHSVIASDSDQVAVGVAADNARRNCALPSVRVVAAQGFAHPRLRGMTFDLILANLLARALHDLAPAFRRHLSPGGTAVLSGLTRDQSRSIEARYRNFGFVPTKRILLDGWTTLVLIRRD